MKVLFRTWDEVASVDLSNGLDPICWPFGFWLDELDAPDDQDAFMDEIEPAAPGFRILRIAGVQYAEEVFRENPTSFVPGSRVSFVRESSNNFDPEAIAVKDLKTGKRFGYLPRDVSARTNLERDFAGASAWVLCHWRRKEGWEEPDMPMGIHVLVRGAGNSAPVEFPKLTWDYDFRFIRVRSTGPE